MTNDQNRYFKKIFLLTVLFGFSFLFCSLALATQEKIESDDGNWVFINDEGIIDAPLSIVVDHFKDVKKADTMIPGLKIKKILKQITDSERIDFDHFETPWPFKDRYIIYLARQKNVSKGEILLTMTPLDNFPFKDNDKVPARIKKSSFLLQSLPENESKTRVKIILAVDLGGYLPTWLINIFAKTWSKDLLQNLRVNIRNEIIRQEITQTNWPSRENTRPSSSF